MKRGQTIQAKTFVKPNLALVTLPLPLHNRAGQVSLRNFIELLESLANSICVITGNFDNRFKGKNVSIRNGSYDTRTCTMPVKMVKYLLMQVRTAFTLAKILRRENIDLVIFFIGSSLVIPLFLAKLLRKRTLIVATGSQWKSAASQSGLMGILLSRVLKFAESIDFSLANIISVESRSVKDFLGLDRYREKLLYYFGARYVDTDLFTLTRKTSQKEDSIGYVGRLSTEKGILNLLAAIPEILRLRPSAHFSIVGDGPLFSQIENSLTMNERHKVEIKRWIPHEKLPAFFNDFKLVVVPSYTEGVPAVVQEAMACGTIVLATAVGGIPDLIEDNKTGFILNNNSPKCIAERILEVLNRPDLDEIAFSARELLAKEYSYEALLKKCRIALARAYIV